MNPKYLRLTAILAQALYCLLIFIGGIISGVSFFYTFIGPAVLLAIIAFTPRFYYDLVAIGTIVLMAMLALLFSVAVVVFNHEYLLGAAVAAVPIICLATLLHSMGKMRKKDPSYA